MIKMIKYISTEISLQSEANLPATQSCILSASRTLHSSVHLVKAVGMLERVPGETERTIMFRIKANTQPKDRYINNNPW